MNNSIGSKLSVLPSYITVCSLYSAVVDNIDHNPSSMMERQ